MGGRKPKHNQINNIPPAPKTKPKQKTTNKRNPPKEI